MGVEKAICRRAPAVRPWRLCLAAVGERPRRGGGLCRLWPRQAGTRGQSSQVPGGVAAVSARVRPLCPVCWVLLSPLLFSVHPPRCMYRLSQHPDRPPTPTT